jgi:dipeptidyl aminopeptidase/acylaminoacyl peptidase
MLSAPFSTKPTPLVSFGSRYREIQWGNEKIALATEWWWKNRNVRTWIIKPDVAEAGKTLLFDYSWEDRYNDPGQPLMKKTASGRSVLLIDNNGKTLYLSGAGASPEGDRPFFDELDLTTQKKNRLWRSQAPYYERPIQLLDPEMMTLLTRREAIKEPPNYFIRDLKNEKLTQITDFPHPTPQLADIQKELIRYDREDGIRLTGTLYLPPNYKPEDGPLPMLVWAYPGEYKSADAAGQVTASPYRFVHIGWWSPAVWVAMGYAVLDDPTMPIVGEGDEEPNDTYVEQLVASAKAAVDVMARRGVAEPGRITIAGHSYGAFMTANLLAHSDFFSAGIARSGAYNRTLTPFGFQAEERTFWEAPEVYFKMSPFMHAEKVNEPILLIHGEADNNSGTFPIQSKRFYHAIKGHGGMARLVMLPHESHGYRARESILHMLWETNNWLEKHMKNAPPKEKVKAKEKTSMK